MYDVRRLQCDDIEWLRDGSKDASWSLLDSDLTEKLLKGVSYVGTKDNRLLVAGGIVRVWPGVGEAWFAVTPEGKKHAAFVYRQALAYLNVAAPHYRRIQATIAANFPDAVKFVEKLGFTNDTPNGLANYGPNGETYYLYSKVL
jgi:hypothetical protein